jgi:hypothetical protein|tara:strand:+ start:1469 stop:1732 length:264 start_codon:yes stop_codon:yes gene_type:complete
MADPADTLMSDSPRPTIYLDSKQLADLGDVGEVGSKREIHCKVEVSSLDDAGDGATATLEIVDLEFMEDDEYTSDSAPDRMYPTMKA